MTNVQHFDLRDFTILCLVAALVWALTRCREDGQSAAARPVPDAEHETAGKVQPFPHEVERTSDRRRASGE